MSIPTIEIGDAELKPVLKSEAIISAAELSALRADAARWRWCRRNVERAAKILLCVHEPQMTLDIDAAIAAMSEQGEGVIGTVKQSWGPDAIIITAAEIAHWKRNSERWEWAKACAVDEDDGGFILYPGTAFTDRDYDPDAEAFEAAVDAAIAAEKGK